MNLLRPQRLKRYKDVAALLVKYGRSDLVEGLGLEGGLAGEPSGSSDQAGRAMDLARDLERLGPTYIKLGQLLSTRGDMLPPAYVVALSRLQDEVEPFPFAEAKRVVEAELGVRLSKAFSGFEAAPLAAASLGQVHRAWLRDGRPVAVKVQRPGIREQIAEDFEAFEGMAQLLERHSEAARSARLVRMVGQFRRTLGRELDYRREAQNLRSIGANLERFPRIFVPCPVDDFTTARVLTMDFVPGKKVTAVTPLERIDIDGSGLAEELFAAYLKQVVVDGIFHADPHPGNVLLTDQGTIALVDLGMVATLSPRLQDELLRLLLAISEGQGDAAADGARRIGERLESFDGGEFRRRIAELVAGFQQGTMENVEVGRILLEISRIASETGIRLPPDLTMLGKTLLNLDSVGRSLDPDFDPNASVRRNSGKLLRERMWKSATPGNLMASVLEVREFLEKLPGRVNRVLDLVAGNKLRVRVDSFDERILLDGLQKVANRIAMGLVLASLIVGAALLMQVPTRFRLLGYPGLAILCFSGAAAGGVLLVLSILKSDRKPRE